MNETLWLEYAKHMQNEGVTKLRLKKLKVMFVTISRGITDLQTATREDIERYLDKITNDKLSKKDGNPFSATTKLDIKKFLKQFYKWLRGKNEFYPPEVSWIKLRISKDELPPEKEILTPEEIIKLSNNFQNNELRMAILLLFDSGFRINELMSCKKNDLTFEGFDDKDKDIKCFWLYCRDSKTFDRKIPVQLFTDDIKSWLNTESFKSKNDSVPLFAINPDSLRLHMKKKCLKLFGKSISIHNLRHSSATYYAKEFSGNSMMLAQRYGWTFNSKQLATYIRRSGAYHKIGAKQVFNNKLSDIEQENKHLKDRLNEQEQEMKDIKEMLKGMMKEGTFKHLNSKS